MSDKLTAADALRKWQKQCDPEGIEVQVSRQALDEVLDALEAKDAEIERLEAKVKRIEDVLYEIFDMTNSGGIEALINKALEDK